MTAVDPLIGRDLDGRYTIVDKLGHGGMGNVYRAKQHGLGREVAIKVVTPRLGVDKLAVKRFIREAQLAGKLSHPNAVAMLESGQTKDGMLYLVMELVPGRTLEEVVGAEGKLSAQRVVRIGTQICDALEGAHALQIVHRDLKPANIMLTASSRDLVKVLDFGLAKSLSEASGATMMTSAGAVIGTPAFMPPESVTGGVVDHRADLYSLGCTLFFAAMGKLPFESTAVAEMIAMHAVEPPPPLLGVQVGLANVIERLLAKAPTERYANAAETRDALEVALSAGAAVVTAPTPTKPPTRVGAAERAGTQLGWATPASGVPVTTPRTAGSAPIARPSTGPTPIAKPSTPIAKPPTGPTPLAKPPIGPSPITKPPTGPTPLVKPVSGDSGPTARATNDIPLPSPSSVVAAAGSDDVSSSSVPSAGNAATMPASPTPVSSGVVARPATGQKTGPVVQLEDSRKVRLAWTAIILVILASIGLVLYTLAKRSSVASTQQHDATQTPVAAPADAPASSLDASEPIDAAEALLDAAAPLDATAPSAETSPPPVPEPKRPKKPRQKKDTPKPPDKPVLRRTPGVGGN
ncbi:MAG TPA: protein kinase [Kofleriaceae bacterium]